MPSTKRWKFVVGRNCSLTVLKRASERRARTGSTVAGETVPTRVVQVFYGEYRSVAHLGSCARCCPKGICCRRRRGDGPNAFNGRLHSPRIPRRTLLLNEVWASRRQPASQALKKSSRDQQASAKQKGMSPPQSTLLNQFESFSTQTTTGPWLIDRSLINVPPHQRTRNWSHGHLRMAYCVAMRCATWRG